MRIRALLLAVTLGVVLALSGCGSSGSSGSGYKVVPGARVIAVQAQSFSFSPSTITIKAGEDVTIKLTATDTFHDFAVDKGVGTVVSADGGSTKEGGLKITKAVTYTFYCTIPGHRQAGMEGKLVVG